MFTRFLVILFLAVLMYGCAKEYSFEGGTLPPPVDTTRVIQPVNQGPVCRACIGNVAAGQDEWTFKSGTWKFCGSVDTAIALGDRTTFTFFGPSACSPDTGMVITVYLSGDTLNRDRQNLHVNRAAFYCYDRVTPTYIFMSQTSNAFSVIIESYTHSTGIAVGSFRGTVFRTDGAAASIDSGRFRIKLL